LLFVTAAADDVDGVWLCVLLSSALHAGACFLSEFLSQGQYKRRVNLFYSLSNHISGFIAQNVCCSSCCEKHRRFAIPKHTQTKTTPNAETQTYFKRPQEAANSKVRQTAHANAANKKQVCSLIMTSITKEHCTCVQKHKSTKAEHVAEPASQPADHELIPKQTVD
jgi:hypothetical protein